MSGKTDGWIVRVLDSAGRELYSTQGNRERFYTGKVYIAPRTVRLFLPVLVIEFLEDGTRTFHLQWRDS